MPRKFSELRATMSPERQARNHLEKQRLLAELPLEELRSARNLTQSQLAGQMGLSQASISKIERRADMYISTLSHFVEAMGGRLEIRAVFPEGEISISQFKDLTTQ